MGRNLLLNAIGAIALSIGLFGPWSEAAATPFTYEFNIPTWTFNSNAGLFGSYAVFDVTVDNHVSSGLGQSFAFSSIQSVSVTAVGGSCSPCFHDTWPVAPFTDSSDPSTVFLLTDSSGVPTLDLSLQSGDTNFVSHTNANGDMFSISQPGIFGYIPSEIDLSNGADSAGIFDSPFSVLGSNVSSVVSSVPEPSTLALFGAGLAAVGWSLRRRKQCCFFAKATFAKSTRRRCTSALVTSRYNSRSVLCDGPEMILPIGKHLRGRRNTADTWRVSSDHA
jgi:hypothetical protein